MLAAARDEDGSAPSAVPRRSQRRWRVWMTRRNSGIRLHCWSDHEHRLLELRRWRWSTCGHHREVSRITPATVSTAAAASATTSRPVRPARSPRLRRVEAWSFLFLGAVRAALQCWRWRRDRRCHGAGANRLQQRAAVWATPSRSVECSLAKCLRRSGSKYGRRRRWSTHDHHRRSAFGFGPTPMATTGSVGDGNTSASPSKSVLSAACEKFAV